MLRAQLLRVCNTAFRTQPFRAMQQKTERCINQVTLLGRVGRDAELKGSDEHPMASFTMATSESIRSRQEDGDVEFSQKTSWHRVCVFKPGLMDAVYTYCKKGDRVHVSGRIDYNEYTNPDGVRIYQTSIIADDVIFLGESRRSEY